MLMGYHWHEAKCSSSCVDLGCFTQGGHDNLRLNKRPPSHPLTRNTQAPRHTFDFFF